jgi:hypothetical protein
LDGARSIVGLVFSCKCSLGHATKSVCWADLNDALRRFLAEDHILCLDPSDRRCELVCEKLDQEGVREILLDFWTHLE